MTQKTQNVQGKFYPLTVSEIGKFSEKFTNVDRKTGLALKVLQPEVGLIDQGGCLERQEAGGRRQEVFSSIPSPLSGTSLARPGEKNWGRVQAPSQFLPPASCLSTPASFDL